MNHTVLLSRGHRIEKVIGGYSASGAMNPSEWADSIYGGAVPYLYQQGPLATRIRKAQ